MRLEVTYHTGAVEVFKDVVYWDFNKADFLTIQTANHMVLLSNPTVYRIDIIPQG